MYKQASRIAQLHAARNANHPSRRPPSRLPLAATDPDNHPAALPGPRAHAGNVRRRDATPAATPPATVDARRA